jgi:HEPN domain-containing protein
VNRTDLKTLARQRRLEAKKLLDSKYFPGAYYLVGLAVECALKACIAKQTKRHDFPDKKLTNNSYSHNLAQLLKLAGLGIVLETEKVTNTALYDNWAVVKDWSIDCRYEHSISESRARGIYSAVTARKNGVLSWLMRQW